MPGCPRIPSFGLPLLPISNGEHGLLSVIHNRTPKSSNMRLYLGGVGGKLLRIDRDQLVDPTFRSGDAPTEGGTMGRQPTLWPGVRLHPT